MAQQMQTDTATNGTSHNTTDDEVARFAALADTWWDAEGPFRPLHQLNPVRLAYVRDQLCSHFGLDARTMTPLAGLRVLDIGCGGGLIAEPLARMGATVTAIDAAEKNVAAARAHAARSGIDIDYRNEPAEALAVTGTTYDVVLALEVVEHVADLPAFMATCAELTRPGGALFFATLNRTPASWALGIVVAEYLLGWLPRGTHDWKKFVRPSELVKLMRGVGLAAGDLSGLSYDPFDGSWRQSRSLAINYMAFASRPADQG